MNKPFNIHRRLLVAGGAAAVAAGLMPRFALAADPFS